MRVWDRYVDTVMYTHTQTYSAVKPNLWHLMCLLCVVTDGATVLITHSNNIFMERLVDMKELETPMYVTNNQQSMDFVWHRESGIDIVIRVSGVFLVPEYRELDALDDSVFFLRKKTEEQRMQELFLMTQNEYCRLVNMDMHLCVCKLQRVECYH